MIEPKINGLKYEFFTNGATLTGTDAAGHVQHHDFTPDWELSPESANTPHQVEYVSDWC